MPQPYQFFRSTASFSVRFSPAHSLWGSNDKEEDEVDLAYDFSPREGIDEPFFTFLEWLSPDIDEAGRRYITIHAGLVAMFTARGCETPHDLADRTLDRVIAKIDRVAPGYEGRPAAYIHGVAKKIALEHLRSRRRFCDAAVLDHMGGAPPCDDETERRHELLERGLAALCPEDRSLILSYYEKQGLPKIESRRGLAEESRVSSAALRKRTQRIRDRLRWSLTTALRDD
jgi:DNA-directed RNA polymerase specialized sigma24 family protein